MTQDVATAEQTITTSTSFSDGLDAFKSKLDEWLCVFLWTHTKQCEAPRAERAAAPPGRRRTSGGSAPPRSSRSKDSGGRSGERSDYTPGSALLSLAAAHKRHKGGQKGKMK